MKAIGRFILAILIIALCFAVVIGVCWLLGTAAHAIGFLPYMLDGDTFDWIVMDGMLVFCMIALAMCLVGMIVVVAQALE